MFLLSVTFIAYNYMKHTKKTWNSGATICKCNDIDGIFHSEHGDLILFYKISIFHEKGYVDFTDISLYTCTYSRVSGVLDTGNARFTGCVLSKGSLILN